MEDPWDDENLSSISDEIAHSTTDISDETDRDEGDSFSTQIETLSTNPRGYKWEISEETADFLYDQAGLIEKEINNKVSIMPSPHVMSTSDELLISEAKSELRVDFALDEFQLQSLLALLNGHNALVITPCGSGKMLIYYLGVYIMKKKFNL